MTMCGDDRLDDHDVPSRNVLLMRLLVGNILLFQILFTALVQKRVCNLRFPLRVADPLCGGVGSPDSGAPPSEETTPAPTFSYHQLNKIEPKKSNILSA